MKPLQDYIQYLTRRHFFAQGANLLGGAAIASLMGNFYGGTIYGKESAGLAKGKPASQPIGPHFAPKAKHVIYLHMVGGPPQMDMYDYKPVMNDWYDKDLPDSI